MIMRRIVLLSVLALAVACTQAPVPQGAQDASLDYEARARALIAADHGRVSCQLHHYETPVIRDTRPPRGYKPVYVSHFSRHGSRYMTSKGTFSGYAKPLRRADSLGLLTDTGRALLADIEHLRAEHSGMSGYLTQRGGLEHQGVAERLYARYPRMFRQRGRREVLAVASTVVRCNQSMMNFGTALKGKAPQLDIVYVTNDRTDESLTRVWRGTRSPEFPGPDDSREKVDSVMHSRIHPERFISSLFTDTTAARACFTGRDFQRYMYELCITGGISQCLDGEQPDIYRYYTEDELFACWVAKNCSALNQHGYTAENGEVLRRVGQYIVRDILAKADEALSEGSGKVADLRFSHDGGVLPLKFFLGVEGCDSTWRIGSEWEQGWYAWQQVCMCTNVQMIFARNRHGDVVVKFLDNERETTIKGLSPWKGPWYRWSELRPWLYALVDFDCEVRE